MTRTLLIVIFFASPFDRSEIAADDSKIEFFEKNIRPVLVENCYQCHSAIAKNVRGGLLLDSKAGMQAGGESGDLIVAGKPGEGLLLSSLRHESFEMPPDRRLSDRVISNFERWIADGAVDPRANGKTIERDEIDLAEGRKFWSFQPILLPRIPEPAGEWSQSDIDRFIASRHEQEGVAPAADARPFEIVRRMYFGLIGLPPTGDQIEQFVTRWNVSSSEAIATTCDELLDSPRFGERWGRHWLDVTRFAESSGGGRSLMFPHAWRFRDYVIRSFNDDKPFDQLIREHVAGDLLPSFSNENHDDQLTGSGYLALGATNYELQDKALLQMEVIDEQIDTLGRTFLGLTLGCARCHDHKFDPVPTRDYYALAGIFRSTKSLLPGNVSSYVTTSLKSDGASSALSQWTKTQQQLRSKVAELSAEIGLLVVEKFIDASTLKGVVVDDEDAVFEGPWKRSQMIAPFVGKGYQHDDFKKTGCRVRFETSLPAGKYRVRLSHNYSASRCIDLPVVISHAGGVSHVRINQAEKPENGVFTELGTYRFNSEAKAVVSIDAEKSGAGVVIVDAVQFLAVEHATDDFANSSVYVSQTAELARLQRRLSRHDQQKPKASLVMSVTEQDNPADGHIHIRGAVRNKGDLVARGFVSVAGKFDDHGQPVAPTIPSDASGRLQLADWLASPDNPLTTRVYVNRIWLHLIGEGLVRTPDNFGKMGQLPTHPELLDYLASTFVTKDEWSTKQLIRRIVNSRTFRLSSETSAADGDPDNRLLTRGFRRRLEAEVIRDSLLQISGRLDLSISGQTIEKISQYDNGYKHGEMGGTMRSVYVPFFRNCMLEIFSIYDVANSNIVSGKRNVSTLPAQALYMLNSPQVLAIAESTAQSFLKKNASHGRDERTVTNQIKQAYVQCLGRMPTPAELGRVQKFLAGRLGGDEAAWASVFQALFASVDFRFVD